MKRRQLRRSRPKRSKRACAPLAKKIRGSKTDHVPRKPQLDHRLTALEKPFAPPIQRHIRDIPELASLLSDFDRSSLVPVREQDISVNSHDVQELLWKIRSTPDVHSPTRFWRFEDNPGHCDRRNGFTPRFRAALIAHAGGRCEVTRCRARGDENPMIVHHVLFVRDKGMPYARNAEVVCIDCHRGAHGVLAFLPPSHALREGFKEDMIAVSGIPIRVMFEITAMFEEAGLLTLEALRRPLVELWDACPPELEDRPTVYDHRISGRGVTAFRTCQILLRRIVRATYVRRTTDGYSLSYPVRPIAGRLHPEAESLLLDFVRTRFIAPLRAPSRAA